MGPLLARPGLAPPARLLSCGVRWVRKAGAQLAAIMDCSHVLAPSPRPAALPAAAASLGDTATPLGKAVRVLNNQLQALAQVDARIEELGGRVSELRTA